MHRAANIINFLKGQSSKLGSADFETPVSTGKLLHKTIASRLLDISSSRTLFTQLAYRAIQFAEHSYCLRDWNSIQEASVILMNLPIPEIQQVGLYYHSNVKYRRGEKAEAENQCKKLIDNAPYLYRARATQALGMIHRERGAFDEALRLNLEALRMASAEQGSHLLVRMWANWEIGLIKSLNGDHQQALEHLERDISIIRVVARHNPFYRYIYNADIAYELGQVGRIAEAESAISVALSSPFARAYPEWGETRNEIEEKRNYPDLSRCFIDRSINESEAIPDSTLTPLVEADTEQATELKPSRLSTRCRFVSQSIFQRPVALPNAVIAIIPGGLPKSFLLQRLGRCLHPRAPPAS